MASNRTTGPRRQQRVAGRAAITRRQLLQGSAAAAALGGMSFLAVGCKERREPEPSQTGQGATAGATPLDLRQSLAALVLALGPWRAEQLGVAENLMHRYVTAERLRGYEDAAPQIIAIASRFPAGARALGEIDLNMFSEIERQTLLRVLHDLYAIQEVRFFLAGQPPPGACMGDLQAFLTTPEDG